MLSFRPTGCSTGCGNCLIGYFRVSLGIYVSVLVGVGATGTGVGGVALGCAGGGCYLGGVAVSQGGNGLLLHKNCVTNRAVLTFRQTGGGTGCGNCLVGYFRVSLGIYVGFLVGVGATGAGVGGLALCGTGGGCYLGSVAMS